jgi:DeoR/GlpR family transcriptional regulator of sugar metabolism
MANPAQIMEAAKRRRKIIILCRDNELTVPEISNAVECSQRSVRTDVEILVSQGYMVQASTKMVGIVETAVFKALVGIDYPLPDESQLHPQKRAEKVSEVIPACGRIVRFK